MRTRAGRHRSETAAPPFPGGTRGRKREPLSAEAAPLPHCASAAKRLASETRTGGRRSIYIEGELPVLGVYLPHPSHLQPRARLTGVISHPHLLCQPPEIALR
jgi:hypothetical protein